MTNLFAPSEYLDPLDDADLDQLRLRVIARQVATEHGVPIKALQGRTRYGPVCKARHEYYYRAYREGFLMKQIAAYINRDRSTVCQVLRKRELAAG